MSHSSFSIALACMTPVTDGNELGAVELPSYGIHRILAAVAADPELEGCQLSLTDLEQYDVDGYVDAILAQEPDLVGMSLFVWSTSLLIEVAKRIKRARPECCIVFGGPSARPALLDLPHFAPAADYVDAIVTAEGEVTFCGIARVLRQVRQTQTPATLTTIPGVVVPTSRGWIQREKPPASRILDHIPSPYQLRLMPTGAVGYLETFRGCPMSCTFCEWGASDASHATFSVDYLVRELQGLAEHQAPAIFLVDAGLNLNAAAFRALREAERQVRFLRNVGFWCEIYPSRVTDDHINFLSEIGPSWLGIGLQSMNAELLRRLQRPFGAEKFAEVINRLSPVAEHIELQIIFGLPTDSPAGFLKTLEFAQSLPVTVRVYHCLVLPDALLTRGRPEWDIEFDPQTLSMRSCAGWNREEIDAMRSRLDNQATLCGGSSGQFWWSFPKAA